MSKSPHCPSLLLPDEDDGLTHLQEQVLMLLEGENISSIISDIIMKLVDDGEAIRRGDVRRYPLLKAMRQQVVNEIAEDFDAMPATRSSKEAAKAALRYAIGKMNERG